MPMDKKTGKKVPYTAVNIKKAKSGKGGLTMTKTSYKKSPMKKSSKKKMSGY